MSDFYIKEMPDNTVTLITEGGHIIGKFDDIEDTSGIILESPDPQTQPADTTLATAWPA